VKKIELKLQVVIVIMVILKMNSLFVKNVHTNVLPVLLNQLVLNVMEIVSTNQHVVVQKVNTMIINNVIFVVTNVIPVPLMMIVKNVLE